MKFSILIDMLFDLLSKRKITAAYLAEKYDISPRTVYRYVELLSAKLPLSIKRGRNGGICLSDAYRLPVGFMSADEYAAAIEALVSAYARQPDPRFLEAKRKLSAQVKTEKQTLVVTGEAGAFYVEDSLPGSSEKIRVLEACLRNNCLAEINHLIDGEVRADYIEPHALLLCKGIWYTYAFSHETRDFQLFVLGNITAIIQTDTPFRRRSFEWSDVACLSKNETTVSVRLLIREQAVPRLRASLGAETLQCVGGKWFAELSLPNNETAVKIVLGFGNAVEVLTPLSLREKVRSAVKDLVKIYS
ncbi:MAG: WYL domain-containing protein [Clostridiales bacterium]|nr:WYL domain-containing protein [Clostridiales bacterium]